MRETFKDRLVGWLIGLAAAGWVAGSLLQLLMYGVITEPPV